MVESSRKLWGVRLGSLEFSGTVPEAMGMERKPTVHQSARSSMAGNWLRHQCGAATKSTCALLGREAGEGGTPKRDGMRVRPAELHCCREICVSTSRIDAHRNVGRPSPAGSAGHLLRSGSVPQTSGKFPQIEAQSLSISHDFSERNANEHGHHPHPRQDADRRRAGRQRVRAMCSSWSTPPTKNASAPFRRQPPPMSTGPSRRPRPRIPPGPRSNRKSAPSSCASSPQKLREKSDDILRIEVMDTGNTIAKMRADVASAGDTLDFYAGFASEIKGETIPASAKNLHFTLREPYGVVGRIIPFNHPIKFAANALAAPADGRQLRRAEAAGNEPALGHHARRDLPRCAAGRRRQYRDRQRHAGGRCDCPPSEHQAARLHRIGADRARHPARRQRRRHQARHARTRRQEPADRLPGHGPGQGGSDRRRRHELRLARPILRLDQPAAAARIAL